MASRIPLVASRRSLAKQGIEGRSGNSAATFNSMSKRLEAGLNLFEGLVHSRLELLSLRNLELAGVQNFQWIPAEAQVSEFLVIKLVKRLFIRMPVAVLTDQPLTGFDTDHGTDISLSWGPQDPSHRR